jgi:hypothetical protein
MKRKKINHNDLLPWFTMDHGQLPASYLKSCQEFFKSLGIKTASNKLQADKLQATSSKPQATSDKLTQRQTEKKE